MSDSRANDSLPPEIIAYYEKGGESQRLLRGEGQLEFARTQEIILRYLRKPAAVVLDVGGGTGLYCCWLAGLGYEVHLVDAVPLHIEQARAASSLQPAHPIASFTIGDARRLEREESSVDCVLLLGPLYHLTERDQRVASLREARRVLKSGGVLFAAAISRFASALDGLADDQLEDPDFVEIVLQDLRNGQHRNRTARDYFTTAYLHLPLELKDEVKESGFADCELLAVEGPVWLAQNLEQRWRNPKQREMLLVVARLLEKETCLMGASAHFMAVARK
jgi:ubiquinone/menaquinone biosynthesis C-methylase UbiE